MNIFNFINRFPDEAACKIHFFNSRVAEGVKCKKCKGLDHWWLASKEQFECKQCHFRTTLRSGTVLEHTKLPFKYWVMAIHLMSATKKSFSALEIQRQLGHKRYQPVWFLLHKLRIVMGKRDSQYKLSKVIEMDEGFFESVPAKEIRDENSIEKKKRGRGSQKQAKVLVAIESQPIPVASQLEKNKHKPSRKAGYLKMEVMIELSAPEINYEVAKMVKPDAKVMTDGYKGYNELGEVVSSHKVCKIPSPEKASKIFPWVHSAIGNAKKILLGTHHSVGQHYLQNYLNEFCYKFNRRYFGEGLFDRLMVASVSKSWKGYW